jgi:N-acetylglucosaminyldiphosphoundecaprenol N-acetyl-beta-D-mannosaminyltransferase
LAIERIDFLKVPLDIVPPEDLEKVVLDLLSKNEPQHIMLMSLRAVMRARQRGDFRNMVQKAALVIPTSKSLIRGARFLKKKVPVRYYPFNLIIDVLGILERYYKSLYLLGAQQKSLMRAERNVRSTFPKLGVVGRFTGHYHKNMEHNILTAIVKSNPSLVLVGDGIPGGQKWIHRNRAKLHGGLFIWDRDVIDIFSERKRRVSEKLFDRGYEYLPMVARNPLRFFRIFQYLWYNILLIIYRLFRTAA